MKIYECDELLLKSNDYSIAIHTNEPRLLSSEGNLIIAGPKLLFDLKQRLFLAISEAPHLHTAVIRSIAQKPVIVEGQQSDLALSRVTILNF